MLGGPHAGGAHQDGPAGAVETANSLHHALPLGVVGGKHSHAEAESLGGEARRHRHGAQAVDVPELPGHLPSRPGHARQPQIAPEEALIADAGDRLAVGSECQPLLRLDQRMDPALEGAIGSAPAGGEVDDLDGFVADQVVAVPLEEMLRRERALHPLLTPPLAGEGASEGPGELFEAGVSLCG